jgi:autotransporter-associated beta strand protein
MIRSCLLVAAILGIQAFCGGATPSFAAPIGNATWTGGGGSGNWSTSSNWSTIPTTSGTWNLSFGGATQTTSTNTIGTITLGTMSFTNNGSAGQTATFTLSGSTLALTNGSIVTTATNGGSLPNNGDTVGNALTLTGSNSFTIGAGHNLAATGAISGAGSIQVIAANDSGWLYLNGSNSYSGGTTIAAGLVQNGVRGSATDFNSSAFGTGAIVVSGSGTVAIRNNSTIANNFTIGGDGATSGTSSLGAIRGSFGTNNQTATVSGSVALSANASITTAASANVTGSKLVLSGPVNLSSSTLTLRPALASSGTTAAASAPIELTGVVSGSGSVVVAADPLSSVFFSGLNTYSGGSTIQSGTLRVGSGSALGTGSLAVSGGGLDLNGQSLQVGSLSGSSNGLITSAVAGNASLTTTVTSTSTYAGSITNGSGVVSLSKTGTGSLYLTGSSSYSGGTTITSGLVQNGLRNSTTDYFNDAFGTGTIVVSGSGTVAIRNNSTIANGFTIGGAGATSGSSSLGAIRGSFGTNNQTATISGSVALSANATIATAASANVTGSKLVLSGPVNLGSNTLTLSPARASNGGTTASALPIELSGAISGAGAVVIAADPLSSVLLSGSSNYSGGTTVDAGTLRVGNAHAVGTGALVVNSGGILDVNGQSLAVGSLQLNSGAATLMGISGTAVGLYDQVIAATTVSFGGALVIDFNQDGFAVGDIWQLFSGSSYSGNFSSVTATGLYGDLTFNDVGDGEWKATGGTLGVGQSLSFYENNSQSYNGMFTAGQLVLVPEPSTVVIAAIGALLAGGRALRRRRAVVESRCA